MALTIKNSIINNLLLNMIKSSGNRFAVAGTALLLCFTASAQETKVTSRLDATSITVGDQARLFIDVQHDPASGNLQWAIIPDSFNHLEVVEKGKIDTLKQGNIITYRQRLLITGFDSGVFKIPPFVFAVAPTNGNPYAVQSDSMLLTVQT